MGLPLQRYMGGYIKLYRSNQTNYIALISTCPPFKVTRDIYLFITENGTETPTIKGYEGLTPLFNTKKLTRGKKLPKYTAEVFDQNKTVKQWS